MLIQHVGLDIKFELPELYQRDVEEFFKTSRAITQSVKNMDDVEAGTALVQFIKALQDSKIKLDAKAMQAVVQEFMGNLRIVHDKLDIISSPEQAGIYVRTFARLGWLGDIKEEDIPKLTPAQVTFISDAVQAEIVRRGEVPPE